MKRIIGCAVLGLSLALPNVSEAHGYYGGRHYHHGPGEVIGDLIALPFIAAATVVGVAATVATAPFYAAGYYDQPAPAYYQPAPTAYYPPQPVYYAPAPRVVYRQPAPVYYAPPRVVYAPPRVVYHPYYAPAPAYYEQAPAGY